MNVNEKTENTKNNNLKWFKVVLKILFSKQISKKTVSIKSLSNIF